MRAISSLWEPESEDNLNVRALLDSTAEVVDRAKIYARWWRLWRADVRAGWIAFGRYKVSYCAGQIWAAAASSTTDSSSHVEPHSCRGRDSTCL